MLLSLMLMFSVTMGISLIQFLKAQILETSFENPDYFHDILNLSFILKWDYTFSFQRCINLLGLP